MSQQLKQSIRKISVWIAAEIVLNFLNLDTVGDYSEFVFQKEMKITPASVVTLI